MEEKNGPIKNPHFRLGMVNAKIKAKFAFKLKIQQFRALSSTQFFVAWMISNPKMPYSEFHAIHHRLKQQQIALIEDKIISKIF